MDKRYIFSAPGRTELGGNHTDHQHGCVLAAAVHLETVARVTLNETKTVCIRSEGYPPFQIELGDYAPRQDEQNSSAALVRGIFNAFSQRDAKIQGFNMEVRSDVLPGSGLSSSAAFEVLVGTICNTLFFGNQLDAVEIAKIGQQAENIYFGKPCGLMDQMASAVGGLVYMDFETDPPTVEKLDFDFEKAGYALCIIDSGADHADLTEEYAAITRELSELCAFFGKEYLRQVPEDMFMAALPLLRKKVSDRAILRAIHVFGENRRVRAQAAALRQGRIDDYLALVNESGRSSWMYLQNIYPAGATQQPVAFALALCGSLLAGQGACRVHGGGFAGTVQAYVPLQMLVDFTAGIEAVLGKGCLCALKVRPQGGAEIL